MLSNSLFCCDGCSFVLTGIPVRVRLCKHFWDHCSVYFWLNSTPLNGKDLVVLGFNLRMSRKDFFVKVVYKISQQNYLYPLCNTLPSFTR